MGYRRLMEVNELSSKACRCACSCVKVRSRIRNSHHNRVRVPNFEPRALGSGGFMSQLSCTPKSRAQRKTIGCSSYCRLNQLARGELPTLRRHSVFPTIHHSALRHGPHRLPRSGARSACIRVEADPLVGWRTIVDVSGPGNASWWM